ncbi:MAG: hypothetical protein ACSLE6_11545 [Mycobacterium sp.]
MTEPVVPTDGVHRSRFGTVIASIALMVALSALGLAIYTWLQSRPVEYTADQQVAAKKTACAAYSTVSTGVATNTNLAAPGGETDVTGSLAVAANARVALIGGGQYILARIEPATPAEIAEPIDEFADTLLDFGAASTAGALNTDQDQVDRLARIDDLNKTLQRLCR